VAVSKRENESDGAEACLNREGEGSETTLLEESQRHAPPGARTGQGGDVFRGNGAKI